MKLTDYLNGRRGREIVCNWGGALVVVVVLLLTIVMCLRAKWADFPSGAVTLLSLLVATLGASKVAQDHVNKDAETPENEAK